MQEPEMLRLWASIETVRRLAEAVAAEAGYEAAESGSVGRYPKLRFVQNAGAVTKWIEFGMGLDAEGRRFEELSSAVCYELGGGAFTDRVVDGKVVRHSRRHLVFEGLELSECRPRIAEDFDALHQVLSAWGVEDVIAGGDSFTISPSTRASRGRLLTRALGPRTQTQCTRASSPVYNASASFRGDSSINPNRHGIRSAEFSSGAMPEGFGHFVASVAFNADRSVDADGEFRYYKDADEALLPSYETFESETGNRLVSLKGGTTAATAGGANRWTELECSNDWEYALANNGVEVTTEIDWLRFFWRLMTSSASSSLEFWDVVHLATYTQQVHPWDDETLWPMLQDSMQDEFNASLPLFNSLSHAHGVFNDGP